MFLKAFYLITVLLIWDTFGVKFISHINVAERTQSLGGNTWYSCAPKKVEVTWLDKNGRVVTNGNGYQLSRNGGVWKLKIPSVQAKHYGKYTCVEKFDGENIFNSTSFLNYYQPYTGDEFH